MGDFTRRMWLAQPDVAERLKISDVAWNSASNQWLSDEEAAAFQSSGPYEPSFVQFGEFLDLHSGADAMRDKSIFVTILPKDKDFFSVCPIISVQEGDFLGVFAGMVRYSTPCNVTYGVPGPGACLMDADLKRGITFNSTQHAKGAGHSWTSLCFRRY
ncbi:hypothetical protein AAEP93_004140 [Penicillium crustosum]